MEVITNTIMRLTEGLKKDAVLKLPISKVCDIDVLASIGIDEVPTGPIEKSVWLRLIIEASTIIIDEYENWDRLFFKNYKDITVSNLKDNLTKLFEDLNNLEFNKFKGCFQVKGEGNTDQEVNLAFKSMFKNENIKSSIQDCCVCLEPTLSHLECGHHLCVLCFDKLEEHQFDCDCKEKKCPLCREGISLAPNMVHT